MSMKKLFSMRNVMLAGAIACVAAFTVTPANADAAKKAVKAAEPLETYIDYREETVYFDGGDDSKKKVFFAFAKKSGTADKIKNWDDVKKSLGEIDISTLIGTKETYIVYKDGANGTPKELKIAAAPKVSLDKKGANVNEGSFHLIDKAKGDKVITGTAIIEVKKGKRGNWEVWGNNEIDEKPVTAGGLGEGYVNRLNKWQKSGATIYVRAAATENHPASNEVSAKIKKLANGPKLTLDPIKVIAKMKKGTEYRVNYNGDNDNDDWVPVDQNKAKAGISLKELADAAKVATSESLTVEYRTAANADKKKSASKITTVAVSGQAVTPDGVIEIKPYTTGKGAKLVTSVSLTPHAPESTDVVEYLISSTVPTDSTKGWKTLKKADTKLKYGSNKNQVQAGSTIYFRIKGVKENVKKGIKLKWSTGINKKVLTEDYFK